MGFNGVATYVKLQSGGLGVVSANRAILGDEVFDKQGRCLMTDHGPFVIFNVYAPCKGGSEKIRFHELLSRGKLQKLFITRFV